jgi:hypothetical protein
MKQNTEKLPDTQTITPSYIKQNTTTEISATLHKKRDLPEASTTGGNKKKKLNKKGL